MSEYVSKSTLQRLPFYLDALQTKLAKGEKYVSSSQLAKELNLNEVQVRKDLASASRSGGKPKVGYEIQELISDIKLFLGCHRIDKAVLVGVGSLGTALLGYKGFKDYGLEIIKAFDKNESIIGNKIKGIEISELSSIKDTIKENNVRIGIITVPAQYAQEVADTLIEAGVKAIWNFAPTRITVPEEILIQNENMASSLAVLSKHLQNKIENEK